VSDPVTADLRTSEEGWVRIRPEPRLWIPCPAAFPDGVTLDSWAASMAESWLIRAGLPSGGKASAQLAAMLRLIHQDGYASVRCHQIWIYLRDYRALPLPVHLGIWRLAGEKDEQLRALAGADDPDAFRPPVSSPFAADHLGTGLRVLRHRRNPDGSLRAVLGFAFRSEELATDLQVWTWSSDLRLLQRSLGDIEAFIRGITLYRTSG
jgi:hypothetical protein